MYSQTEAAQERDEVEEFLNGFDYYEGDYEEDYKFDLHSETSIFVRGGCFPAFKELCISELLSCLTSQFEGAAPQLSRSSSSIDSDLSLWINHWYVRS
jgi:hypothetical protein